MSVTQTSLISFQKLKDNNTLGKMEELVYNYLIENPDQTDAEITRGLGFGNDFNKIRPRRNGCVKKGKVVKVGTRKCTINKGSTASIWRVKEEDT